MKRRKESRVTSPIPGQLSSPRLTCLIHLKIQHRMGNSVVDHQGRRTKARIAGCADQKFLVGRKNSKGRQLACSHQPLEHGHDSAASLSVSRRSSHSFIRSLRHLFLRHNGIASCTSERQSESRFEGCPAKSIFSGEHQNVGLVALFLSLLLLCGSSAAGALVEVLHPSSSEFFSCETHHPFVVFLLGVRARLIGCVIVVYVYKFQEQGVAAKHGRKANTHPGRTCDWRIQ